MELAPRAACLAICVRSGPPLRDAARISAAARAANPRLTVLWGGPHATLAPESCLELTPGARGGRLRARRRRGAAGGSARGDPLRAGPGGHPRPRHAGRRSRRAETAAARPSGSRARATRCSTWSSTSRRPALAASITVRAAVRAHRRTGAVSARSGCWRELGELAERHGLNEVAFRDEDFYGDRSAPTRSRRGLALLGDRLGWSATVRVDDVLEGGHDRLELLARGRCRKLALPVPEAMAAEAGQRERVLDAATPAARGAAGGALRDRARRAGPRGREPQGRRACSRARSAPSIRASRRRSDGSGAAPGAAAAGQPGGMGGALGRALARCPRPSGAWPAPPSTSPRRSARRATASESTCCT